MPGLAGRKKTSDGIKRMKGTDQPCRLVGDTEIAQINSLPQPPNFLTKDAILMYHDIGGRLFPHGVLNDFNIETFAVLISELSLYIQSMKKVNKEGLTLTTELFSSTGYKTGEKVEINPNRKIAEKAFLNFSKLCVEFGMTPSSFVKMASIIKKAKPINPYEEYLNK